MKKTKRFRVKKKEDSLGIYYIVQKRKRFLGLFPFWKSSKLSHLTRLDACNTIQELFKKQNL